jgi:hypothetical protein
MSEWHAFASLTKEGYTIGKSNLDSEKVKTTKEIHVVVPKHPNYELIIKGDKMTFRVRNSKDKMGMERWTLEISHDAKSKSLKENLKEMIILLSEKRKSETWLEMITYSELSTMISKSMDSNTLDVFQIDLCSVMHGEIEESYIAIAKDNLESDLMEPKILYYRSYSIHGTGKKISDTLKKKDLSQEVDEFKICNYSDLLQTLLQ